MTALTVIYSIGALALGFLLGMVLQVFIDSDQIRRLIKINDRLKLENEALMNGHTEVIEIVDKRQPEEVDFSQKW